VPITASLGPAGELSRRRLCEKHNGCGRAAADTVGTVSPAAPQPKSEPGEPLWWGNHLGELRWQLDAARLLAHPVLRGQGVPRGDGRPVLLLPGFLAGDYTLAPMALWLRRIGYRPARIGLLTNTGCSQEVMKRLEARAETLAGETGRRVAVIGHSRGAHQGKVLAVRRPELVSHVIGLGGGLNRQMDVSAPTAAVVALARAWQRRTAERRQNGCLAEDCRCSFTREYSAPFPESVRLTSVYSKSDGVVRWRSCVVPYADNVEVRGTHVGLALNPEAYVAIATALARPLR
jgi:pimeloyl-ACP methyl ester carboxylesterase